MPACDELNLGGRTPENPCLGTFGICSWTDFQETRYFLVIDHNALVHLLNRWNKLVAAGKATWTALPNSASVLYEESLHLLAKYPASLLENFFSPDVWSLSPPVTAFVAMTMKVHAMVCDMENQLESLGEVLPQKPAPPKKPPKGILEETVDFAKAVGQGLVTLAVVGVVGFLGYTLITRRQETRQLALANASASPAYEPLRRTGTER